MSDGDHSTCKETLALLREYLEGELTPALKAKLEAHFGGCSPCEEFVRSYLATPELCRKALKQDDVPEEVADSLSAFLRRELAKS
jgi:hypothetical protein